MHLITDVPKYSDGELDAAFMREIQTGFQLERQLEKARIQEAAQEARTFDYGREIKGLGRKVAEVPARDFFRLQAKYGVDEVRSKAFVYDMVKRMPELKVKY
jgi:hypothetical protein